MRDIALQYSMNDLLAVHLDVLVTKSTVSALRLIVFVTSVVNIYLLDAPM